MNYSSLNIEIFLIPVHDCDNYIVLKHVTFYRTVPT